MSQNIYRLVQTVFVATVLFSLGAQQSAISATAPPGGSVPIPNPCAGYLTSTPDSIIAMQPNTAFYKKTIDLPQTAPALAMPGTCGPRWVTEITVPLTTSSGCPTCSAYAEIAAGADKFPGSVKYENEFFRPLNSKGETFCKSYKHSVAVYFKPAGASAFQLKRNLYYTGHWENSACHVKATYLGNPNWDTSEVYAPISIPATGTSVYRLLQYIIADGLYRDINVVVEFEKP